MHAEEGALRPKSPGADTGGRLRGNLSQADRRQVQARRWMGLRHLGHAGVVDDHTQGLVGQLHQSLVGSRQLLEQHAHYAVAQLP